ncbi:hypothetical protein, partial [Bacteroides pyogenes]|uniref:hypothetical protein n=1 Tax=Bacteroides pyogenes TaxID=310300 RepID=UPI002FDA5D10
MAGDNFLCKGVGDGVNYVPTFCDGGPFFAIRIEGNVVYSIICGGNKNSNGNLLPFTVVEKK